MRLFDQLRKHSILAACGITMALSVLTVLSAFAAEGFDLRVLSGRPDMVSGGDALVQLTSPAGSSAVTVTLDGQDVTSAFRPIQASGKLIGLVQGLKVGKNRLEARSGGKVEAKLELVDYPITGPIFSGPHQTPFICQTEDNGLEAPLDADCTAKTKVTYYYKSTEAVPPPAPTGEGVAPTPRRQLRPDALTRGFKPFDPAGPRPVDVAQITTSDGKTVDYIVRRESGTINRAVYEIEFLQDPSQPLPTPWTSTPGWNERLVYSFGGGCNAGYRQAKMGRNGPASAANEPFLSQGYAVADSSLNIFGNNCNEALSAETMMMVKEHFIKEFGVPVHTIGSGGSGGSMQQHLIAQNYPGLLDGLMPSVSFPDSVSVIPTTVDCALLDHAFKSSSQTWTDDQKTAVSGYATFGTCTVSWAEAGFSPGNVVASACDPTIPKDQVYDAETNPKGVRCDLYSNSVNIYGRDPKTGIPRRPLDNVGVQYGLTAFNAGKISADQFLELNQTIGGYDRDGNMVTAREAADPEALRIAYQTGQLDSGAAGLASVPIIDFRPYLDPQPNLHDRFRTFVTRARLKAANGNADNQVLFIFSNSTPHANADRAADALRYMNQWLDNIAKDTSADSPAAKVSRNRPADLSDACWTQEGEKIVEPAAYDSTGRCNQLYPPHADPRIAAGGPLTDNVLKCALKPVNPADYAQPFTPEQVKRLKTIFPSGVCDYSRPGVGQQVVKATWQRF